MGATRKYVVIDPATGKIDRRIFSEQAIYDEEMEKIFGRAWLMIGHESLVPAADDFFHTYMGEDPVILTRDGGGRLHAHLNMCRHRGNRVVRCDDGNAKRFMCTYHGRTYRNDGALIRSIVKHFQKLASAFAALQGSAAKSMVSTLRL